MTEASVMWFVTSPNAFVDSIIEFSVEVPDLCLGIWIYDSGKTIGILFDSVKIIF